MVRTITSRLATNEPNRFLNIKVYYDAGGMCYATYKQKQRGYYLSVSPVTIEDGWQKSVAFSGASKFIEPAARYNAKRLAELANRREKIEGSQELIDYVLAKNGLTLAAAAA